MHVHVHAHVHVYVHVHVHVAGATFRAAGNSRAMNPRNTERARAPETQIEVGYTNDWWDRRSDGQKYWDTYLVGLVGGVGEAGHFMNPSVPRSYIQPSRVQKGKQLGNTFEQPNVATTTARFVLFRVGDASSIRHVRGQVIFNQRGGQGYVHVLVYVYFSAHVPSQVSFCEVCCRCGTTFYLLTNS